MGDEFDIGGAIEALKAGKKVTRAGWNGKGMWLVYIPGTPKAALREGSVYRDATGLEECEILPRIDMWTAQGKMQVGWLASQSDLLAEDYHVVD